MPSIKYNLLILLSVLITVSSQSAENVIAKIAEASGISYCANTNTLIVVNDEGTYYEIDTKGKILKKIKLKNYDLEGVVCEEKKILFVREDKGLFWLDRKTGKKKKIALDTSYKGKKYKLFDKEAGIEGIAKIGNIVYLSKQSKKKKHSFIAVFRLKPYPAKMIDIIKLDIPDIAGLTYHDKALYMVSDKKDLLIKYDLDKKKVIEKIKLKKGAWEGIAFDDKGHVYLADDNGRVLKYKIKSLGL
ncbi:MAG: SdiA-regulated domain-containing protein [Sulfurovum sp.]|nr:SdiA-regulated domain-containing protein [Sulfurovum sp.]